MIKTKIRIKKINIENNIFSIESSDNKLYISDIIKGSVNFKIYNEDQSEVNLSNLEEDAIIKVYGKNHIINEKNNIIIKKIIVQNKYIFDSDSSEDILPFN
jgi:hypothetical protein